jgi:Ca2+-binding RTX toxin-like protein
MTVNVNVTAIDDGVAPVTITGTAAKGDVLTAMLGVDPDVGPLPTTIDGYQWFVDGTQIVGEINANHTVTTADVGHNLSVQISYHDAQGFAEAQTSVGVAAAAPFGAAALAAPPGLFIGKVGLTGVVPSGATPAIHAFNTLVDPDNGILPGSEIYSFQTSTDTVTWTDVAAANVSADGLNFIPTGTTTGTYVKVSLTYLDGDNNLNTATSDVMRYIIDTAQSHTLIGGTANGIVDDLIFGNGGTDLITAGAGNDFAQGGGGNDTFFAGVPGTPLSHASDGNDTYDGGAGTDTYNMINTLGVSTVNLTAGTATSAETGNDVLISIENVTGSAGDNSIIGSAATNVLVGNGGNDLLDGGSAGADRLSGGTGNDTYVVSHAGMTLTENNNQGTDTVQSSIAFTLGNNFENLVLSGVAAINGTGNNASNVLTGNDAHNILSGLNGNDTFFISLGGDSYVGGAGVDTFNASAATHDLVVNLATGTASGQDIGASTLSGIETIIGGLGNDHFTANVAPETFTGGLGDDTFIYASRTAAGNGGNRSSILDFHQIAGDRDTIDLSGIDAVNGGAHDAFIFDAVAKAGTGLEANGHLGYFHQVIGGVDHTIIEGNITGIGGNVDFQIDLLGNLTLTTADFHL